MGYARSPVRKFEKYLRITVGFDEHDLQSSLKQYNSNIFTYEIPTGIYSVKDISEVVYNLGNHEKTVKTEYDDIAVETKLFLTRFGGSLEMLRFDEKSFFNTLLGFTPNWECKPTKAFHADFPGVYTSEKLIKLSTIDKIHLKCEVIDGDCILSETVQYRLS